MHGYDGAATPASELTRPAIRRANTHRLVDALDKIDNAIDPAIWSMSG